MLTGCRRSTMLVMLSSLLVDASDSRIALRQGLKTLLLCGSLLKSQSSGFHFRQCSCIVVQAENFFLPSIVGDAYDQLVSQPFVETCAEVAITSCRSESVDKLCDGFSFPSVSLTEDDPFG